ncbi:CMGC protein kinase [[Emmonsia] crescens]|uniref:CMGC protein kinase n=1 Tax=[Emmonsia] crescens TaxID=73230 RepID=A0A2B7ZBT1_9EURO|nr:CMGC protein kinase [Emmonsia crescens]
MRDIALSTSLDTADIRLWLARDTHLDQYVAVKVDIADRSFDSLQQEIKSLRGLCAPLMLSHLSTCTFAQQQQQRGGNSTPLVLDEFNLQGPNGAHLCYTTAPAQCNLKEVSYSRLFPLDVARALSGNLALALAFSHSRGYVHGDVHLRNVLVKLPSSIAQLSVEQLYEKYGRPETITITRHDGNPLLLNNVPPEAVLPVYLGKYAEEFTLSDTQILLSDFGESFSPASDVRRWEDCHTPLAFRAPEAQFEPYTPLSYPSDIWSLATAIWEIIGMKAIFSTEYADINRVLSQHVDLLGPLPSSWWEHWEQRGQFFIENGQPKGGRGQYVWPPIDQAFEDGVQKYRRMDGMGEFDEEETAAVLDLMRRMLAFRPEERPTIEEVLQSEWMAQWVLPDVEGSLQAQ